MSAEDAKQPRLPQIWTEGGAARKPMLTRESIIEAAIALADRDGLGAVSIRRIAGELGARPMSLYRHVPSKDDLLELINDEVLGEEPVPEQPSDDWRADLRLVANLQRQVAIRHPWCIQTAIGRPPVGPNAMRINEFAMATLDRFGLDINTINAHVDTLNGYVAGTLADDLAEADNVRDAEATPEEWQAMLQPWVEQLKAGGKHPMTVRFMLEENHWDDEKSFAFGVERVLDGIAAALPER